MKRTSIALFIASILLITMSSGCRKDIYGCTDPSANNYAPNANVDNGSCNYTQYSTVMFWTDKNEGVVTITINGQSSQITGFVTGGVPNCGNGVSATFSLPLGTYTYTATAPSSPAYPSGFSFTGTARSESGTCNAYQL